MNAPAGDPPIALALSPHLGVAEPHGFALACQLDKGLDAGVDYMALRRGEDARACDMIGAEPVWLPFREAPHRGYHSAAALFAWPRPDDAVADAVAPALRGLLDTWNPSLLLAPQAVGGHVDHLALVRALLASEPTVPILWWQDYPYAIRRERCVEPLARTFEGLDTVRVPLDETSRAAKGRAALAYASQLGFQFGGPEALRDRLSEQGFEAFCARGEAAAVLAARSVRGR